MIGAGQQVSPERVEGRSVRRCRGAAAIGRGADAAAYRLASQSRIRVGGDHPSRGSCSQEIVSERHFVLKGCRNAAPINPNSKIELTGQAGQVTPRY